MMKILSEAYNMPCNRKKQESRAAELLTPGKERDIAGKVVIVTGSNHGIGMQTALEMAKRRAKVVMACRDLTKAEVAKQEILKQVNDADITLMKVDLGDLSSIRTFAQQVKENYDHVDILINNAGIYKFEPTLSKTKDGFENHIGVNHFGTFYLTICLVDLLQKAPERSRVVVVSSFMTKLSELNIEDLNMEKSKSLGFNNMVPYSNSKEANALFVREFAKRYPEIGAYAICPGMVNVDDVNQMNFLKKFLVESLILNLEQGARTSVYCAVSPEVEKKSGNFYRFASHSEDMDKLVDSQKATELWTKTEEMLKERNFSI